MDTNTLIEGTVKFRDGKKWKCRWCVVRKLSPVADSVHLQLYRDSKDRYKQTQTKASLSLENFLGIQSGFTLDKESNTLAIICQEVVVVLAFDTREHLMQWQVKISSNLGEGDQSLVQICSAPAKVKLPPGPARIFIQEFKFCLTVGVPPRLVAFWHFSQLRRFGVVEGKFCFEGGSLCGRGEGLYVLVTEKPGELAGAFGLAAQGKLFTKTRAVRRNMSAREPHSSRPESRLSNLSSQESQGNNSCGFPDSRDDLLSWPQSPSVSAKHDLNSSWSAEPVMGRCTSCASKMGRMTRSSTMNTTLTSTFPAWTMERPKSCGTENMSRSVTCSSVSLSSHSSKGSTGSHSTADRLHSSLPPASPRQPSISSTRKCCCKHGSPTSPSYNYDVPKSIKHNLKLDLAARPQSQASSQDYYDTPRRLKDSLVWDYGNYDVPPPAQPVCSEEPMRETDANCMYSIESETTVHEDKSSTEIANFSINKVKLTGEGRMPVVTPTGQIIEFAEPTYEERLERLLENECLKQHLNVAHFNYENVDNSDYSCHQEKESASNMGETNSNCADLNYSNISVIQSLGNYENCKYIFSEQNNNPDISSNSICHNMGANEIEEIISLTNRCKVPTKFSKSAESLSHPPQKGDCQLEGKNENGSAVVEQSLAIPYLNRKCVSSNCLNEITHEPFTTETRTVTNLNLPTKPFLHCTMSASNSPSLKRHPKMTTPEYTTVCLRHRSNSVDSARFSLGECDSEIRNCDFNTASGTKSVIETGNNNSCFKSVMKLAPLVITEFAGEHSSPTVPGKDFQCDSSTSSSSIPKKSFSNRDSSSSNDSGVSTGSLYLKHCGTNYFNFELPLTTRMSSKKHQPIINNTTSSVNNVVTHNMLQNRSKSVDPLRSLTFMFGSEVPAGKSKSAEAEVPIFVYNCRPKGRVCSHARKSNSDSLSTSSGTSDISDYCETLSFSSISSFDATVDSFRSRHPPASTMKPRSGNEYQKIDRNLID